MPCYAVYAARVGGGTSMKATTAELAGIQEVLERKQADLVHVLRRPLCIQCQEAADRGGQEAEDVSETLVNAA